MALVVLIAGLAVEEGTARPSGLTRLRFELSNASAATSGPIAMMWSIELYNDTLSLEGPRGSIAPSAVRILNENGDVAVIQPTALLDPARNIGVCPSWRPALGTTWWSANVPATLAADLRLSGKTVFRVQAQINDSWVPVTLIDSGCRGVGRA